MSTEIPKGAHSPRLGFRGGSRQTMGIPQGLARNFREAMRNPHPPNRPLILAGSDGSPAKIRVKIGAPRDGRCDSGNWVSLAAISGK